MKQYAKTWGTIVGTVVVVSAVWGFFYLRVTELKDEQLASLRQENERLTRFGPGMDVLERVENRIAAIDTRLIPLTLAMPMDPISGRISVGTGMESPTSVTMLLIDANNLMGERKFDLAEKKIKEIEGIYPRFQGIAYLRFYLEIGKGNQDEAFVYATNLIANLPSDRRILPMYELAVKQLLRRGEKKRAEDLCLAAMSLDATNQNWRAFFKQAFGYEPSVQ